MKSIYIATVLLASCPGQGFANGFEDLDALEKRVAQTAGAPIQPVDRRLKLSKCPDAAEIDAPAMNAIAVRCPALGWRIRFALAARPAEMRISAPRPVIRRGDEVDLTYVGDGFELIAQGVAMDDAGPGEPVRVKSSTSATAARGTAVAPGSVEISR